MGEYAHDAMRQEIKAAHGFDIGGYDDTRADKFAKPGYKRVKCPQCEARPKETGLRDHLRDKHGVITLNKEVNP